MTRHGAAEAASRFPGFDPLDQVPHWDQVTADLIEARVRAARPVTFFTEAERACAAALLEDLTRPAHEPRVPVAQMVEARLAAGETDGWRYEDLPEDGQAWRDTLACLDADSKARCGTTFAEAGEADRRYLIQAVQELGAKDWHGFPAGHVWSLWTRYSCTAFYAHPAAWAEIGFPGRRIHAATRTPAWTGSSRSKCATRSRPWTRYGREIDAQPDAPCPRPECVGLAAP